MKTRPSASDSPEALRSPTVDQEGKRKWIYPDRRSGRHSRQRRLVAIVLIVFYFCAPFLQIGGLPFIRIDVASGIIYGLGQTFRVADGYYIALLLFSAATGIAWVTSRWGRVWCGHACPQTVFVEWLIRPLEEWIEGPAHHRRVVDKQPLSIRVAAKKTLKHSIFCVIILVISNVFLAYFVDPQRLWAWIRSSPLDEPIAFMIMAGVFAALYFDLIWFREQFCAFICPYGRFQSVLISKATPTVAYDVARGEPRGKRGTKGDCIDCGLCVRVCPTGIDIRQGLQLECIQCMRCSDACNIIMKNIGKKADLIRKASQLELEGKLLAGHLRVRPLILFALFALCLLTLGYQIATRDPLKITLLRQAQTTYVSMEGTKIANYFTLRIVNQGQKPETFILNAPAGVRLVCTLCDKTIESNTELIGNLIVIFERDKFSKSLELKSKESSLHIPLIGP